ncbi:TraB/GumN family protein [Parerythrobacter jejuensis]|uniref:TraB/GumN family protein n=1 Tax=Parerythrobacter jejuensis TaxID=795812 RepID=A0A845AU11_9SPHN|nr:TraB/GumN family protein [Parerythrobacter jejuensis]MXP32311.1 TraB/GumN family protein [Parerythrobacter jejuensis]
MTHFKNTLAAAASGIALLFSTGAHAQEQSTPTPVASATAPAADVEMGGPALWKLADEDTTIYLFGTIHVLPKDTNWLSPTIDKALDSSDVLVTEILMTPDLGAKTQQIIMEKGMLPAGTTVRSLMSEEQKTTYETAMTKLGMPVGAFDRFEPWFGAINLSILPLMKEGYSPEEGVEKVLEAEAEEGLQRAALETIEFQMGVFDSLPQEAQVKYLIEAAEGIDDLKPMIDKMVAEWIEGDADALAEMMNTGMEESPALMEALLYDRNANWAVWIDDRMDQPGTVFIAVGAGHLAGEKSVQDLLEARGFTITRVQ